MCITRVKLNTIINNLKNVNLPFLQGIRFRIFPFVPTITKASWWLRLLSFLMRGSVFVDLLFIVTRIVGVCNCSMFCCTVLYVQSSFAIIFLGKIKLVLCLVCLPGVS